MPITRYACDFGLRNPKIELLQQRRYSEELEKQRVKIAQQLWRRSWEDLCKDRWLGVQPRRRGPATPRTPPPDETSEPMTMYSTGERFKMLKAAALKSSKPEDLKQLSETIDDCTAYGPGEPHIPNWIAGQDLEDLSKEKPSKDWASLIQVKGKGRRRHKYSDEEEPARLPVVKPGRFRPGAVLAQRSKSHAADRNGLTDRNDAFTQLLTRSNRSMQDSRAVSLPRFGEKQPAIEESGSDLDEAEPRGWLQPLDMAQLRGQFFKHDGNCRETCLRMLHETPIPAYGLASCPMPKSRGRF